MEVFTRSDQIASGSLQTLFSGASSTRCELRSPIQLVFSVEVSLSVQDEVRLHHSEERDSDGSVLTMNPGVYRVHLQIRKISTLWNQ